MSKKFCISKYTVLLYSQILIFLKRRKIVMKKSFRTLTLGLLTIGMLAACNPPAPAPNWSSDDQKTMSDNLYGVVLPYVSLGNLEVKFDSAQDQVVITGDELESTAVASYAQKFTTADGWTDITPANAAYYSFEKQVNNEAGAKRWVAVQFSNEEYTPASTGGETGPSQSVANEGEATPTKAKRFAIYAADPYSYEFPLEDLQAAVKKMCGVVNLNFPTLQADRYEEYFDISGDNLDFFLVAYDKVAADVEAFKTTLSSAPYNFTVVANPEGGYSASDSHESFQFDFELSEGAITLQLVNFSGWPAATIARAMEALQPASPFTDPLPEVDNHSAVFATAQYVTMGYPVFVQVYVDTKTTTVEAAVAAYKQKLMNETNGFTKGTYRGSEAYFSKTNQFQIDFYTYLGIDKTRCFEFNISLANPDTLAWPTEKVNAYKTAKSLTGNIPAFASASASDTVYFSTSVQSNGTLDIRAYCTNQLDLTDYITALGTNGFAAGGQTTTGGAIYEYFDETDVGTRVVLYGYDTEDKYVEFLILPFAVDHSFPGAKFEAALEMSTGFLPTFTVGTGIVWQFVEYIPTRSYYATADFADEASASAALQVAADAFTNAKDDQGNAKFLSAGTPTASEVDFMTPDGEYDIYIYLPNSKTVGVQINRNREYESAPFAEAIIQAEMDYYGAKAEYFAPFSVADHTWTIAGVGLYNNQYIRAQLVCEFTAEEQELANSAKDAFIAAQKDFTYNSTYKIYEWNYNDNLCFSIGVGQYQSGGYYLLVTLLVYGSCTPRS